MFSRGKLVAQGRKLHPVDYKPGMKTFRNSKKEQIFISQGFIEFVVTHKMVPSCRILLFYVRDDQETVAGNMLIDTEDTLENEVCRMSVLHCLTPTYCLQLYNVSRIINVILK